MTDNEIVKALECCMGCCCKECPNFNENDIDEECCMGRLIVEALKLINRQKAEIERLKEAYAVYEETTGLKRARAEAIKEFAERFKADSSSFFAVENGRELYETKSYQISAVRLDCLVKEMTEDEK